MKLTPGQEIAFRKALDDGSLDIEFYTPRTMDEARDHIDELRFLGDFIPGGVNEDYILMLPPSLTLVYAHIPDKIILSAFSLTLHEDKPVVSLHGVIRQDLKHLFKRHNDLSVGIFNTIKYYCFDTLGLEAIQIVAPKDTIAAKGFAWLNHFELTEETPEGSLYTLTKRDSR